MGRIAPPSRWPRWGRRCSPRRARRPRPRRPPTPPRPSLRRLPPRPPAPPARANPRPPVRFSRGRRSSPRRPASRSRSRAPATAAESRRPSTTPAPRRTPTAPPGPSGGAGASATGTNPFPLSAPAPSFGLPGAASGSCTDHLPAARAAADLPARRRDLLPGPAGARGAGRDQPDRDQLRRAQPGHLLGRRGRLDAVHALDLGELRGGRQRRRPPRSVRPRGRDLRRCLLPAGLGDAAGHRRRDLLLQPRRLVRLRGAGERRLLRLARRQLVRARAAGRGPLLQPGARPGTGRSPPTT